MSFEPQKFFIGLMDFFTILLPGAVLTFLVMDDAGPAVLGCEKYHKLVGVAGWGAFLISSYLLGHVVFLVSSFIDRPFDSLRKATRSSQIAALARGEKLRDEWVRKLAAKCFGRNVDRAHECASALQKHALAPVIGGDAMNVFQWCKAVLHQQSPASIALVQRFEADSKFFRSLVVVLLCLLCLDVIHEAHLVRWVFWLVAILFTAWRYADQRLKATDQAYWCVITLLAQAGPSKAADQAGHPPEMTHAGGVVFRKRSDGAREYLFVSATKDPSELVLPKGHIEPGEDMHRTAVREVLEECGVWASIAATEKPIDGKEYMVGREAVRTRFYLMTYAGVGEALDAAREIHWHTLPELHSMTKGAAERIVNDGALEIATSADQQLSPDASAKPDQ